MATRRKPTTPKTSTAIVHRRSTQCFAALGSALLLASCVSPPGRPESAPPTPPVPEAAVSQRHVPQHMGRAGAGAFGAAAPGSAVAAEREDAGPASRRNVRLGTGVFVREGPEAPQSTVPGPGDVTLNFEASSLREFVQVIFEDILKVNYLMDPKVDGVVTLHTVHPVSREAVPAIVESVLELNGAALIQEAGVFKVVPLDAAETRVAVPSVGKRPSGGGVGYGMQIVPLRNVAAGEIEKVIKPIVPQGSTVRVDKSRNLLILTGPRYRLDQVLETVDILDVDWLKGMSFGLFPLQYADASALVKDLEKILGDQGQGPLAGIVRLVPVERLNAVLVITHHPDHIREVRKLIEQFDFGMETATPGERLYVYHLRNGKAENIASLLQQFYGETAPGSATRATAPVLAPGERPAVFRSAARVTAPLRPPPGMAAGEAPPGAAAAPEAPSGGDTSAGTDAGVSVESRGPVAITADPDNNAILVMASPSDYRMIEAAIRKLDIEPRQVLIDATIAEVTLADNLNYGVQWFLRGRLFGDALEAGLDAPPPGVGGPGLTLALLDSPEEVRLFFGLLQSESSVRFLSAPQVMVLDNQTANIRVGDQIPVTIRASQSTSDPNAPVVTEVQYRDTGTLLTVTPRINAGGQVTLDISQEVSLPGTEPAVGGGGNVAIAQRTINSTVIVQSGQTVVLGGLIRETHNNGKAGIPLLMDLPGVGYLFSNTTQDVGRTELIITISPRVIENHRVAQEVTEELRTRLKNAAEFSSSVVK